MQTSEEKSDGGNVQSEQNESKDGNESIGEANEGAEHDFIATTRGVDDKSVGQATGLSKRKLKRLAKHEKWLEKKEQRKIAKKEQKRMAKEQGAVFPSRSSRRKKQKTMDCEEALPLKIVIDLAYDKYMDNSCIKKLLKQVKACYAVNRKAPKPVQLYLTSFGGESKAVMEEVHHEYENWDMHIKSEAYTDLFDKDDVVYLSSESDNVLTDIDMSKTYIIGGLVDHNHHKGLCHRLAVENHVHHAQLPIKNFVELQSRTVLTVNHVFEIILKFIETKDWCIAFDMVIPKRKKVTIKQTTDEAPKNGVIRSNGSMTVAGRGTTKWFDSAEREQESEGIASLKKLLGFTVCLVFFMAVCAFVFSVLERPHEQQAMAHWQREASVVKRQFNLSDDALVKLITQVEGIKKYGLPRRSKWSFYNAFWFTMTITTTIGFGHITPDTCGGRLFCIVCGLIGIPLNALVLKHVGNKIRLWVTRAIRAVEYKCLGRKRCRNAGIKCACVLFALMVLVIVLGGCLDLIFDGWTFEDGVYFNFIALSTIGFGDIHPSVNHPSKLDTLGLRETEKLLIASGIMVVYLTLGLAVVSSVVVSILTAMEDCDKAKRRLATWRRRHALKDNLGNNNPAGCHDSWKYGADLTNDMEGRYCKQFGFENHSVD